MSNHQSAYPLTLDEEMRLLDQRLRLTLSEEEYQRRREAAGHSYWCKLKLECWKARIYTRRAQATQQGTPHQKKGEHYVQFVLF